MFSLLVPLQLKKMRASNVTKTFVDGNVEMEDNLDKDLLSDAENAWAQREWSIQHVLFPSMRLFLKPPASMASNGTFVKVTISSITRRSYTCYVLNKLFFWRIKFQKDINYILFILLQVASLEKLYKIFERC